MKLFKLAVMTALLFVQTGVFADNPEPYASVRLSSYTPFFLEEGYLLMDRINSRSASIVIDVNSFEGKAARYIAQNASSALEKVYAIQEWKSSEQVKFPYQIFLSNVVREGTTNLIVPIRMTSQEGAEGLSIIADVIYLNNNYKDNVYSNILAWSTHLTTNGIICGNNWQEPAVAADVTNAAASLDLILHINGNFWSLERS